MEYMNFSKTIVESYKKSREAGKMPPSPGMAGNTIALYLEKGKSSTVRQSLQYSWKETKTWDRQEWWYMPVTSALGRLRLKDNYQFEASVD